jgi:hypothetical protein
MNDSYFRLCELKNGVAKIYKKSMCIIYEQKIFKVQLLWQIKLALWPQVNMQGSRMSLQGSWVTMQGYRVSLNVFR